MYFSEFAQRLGRVLIEGSNTSVFVRTLFLEIIPEDRYYLLDEISQNTLKSYYNGHLRINALARKIVACVNVKSFEKFIKRSGKSAVGKLCEVFSDVWADIDSNNVGEKIAKLFDDIITEAAAMNKRQTKKSNEIADFAESRNYETDEGGTAIERTICCGQNPNSIEGQEEIERTDIMKYEDKRQAFNNDEDDAGQQISFKQTKEGGIRIAKNMIEFNNKIENSTFNFS